MRGARQARPLRHAPRRLRASRAPAPSPTGSPASSSRRATPASAAPSRCRARWRCSRSGSWGSEEQKQRWLPPMHAGEAIGCFGLTEPDAGSDPGSMRTTARRDGSDWILNGAKMWITNGTIADVAIVWARTDDGAINGFLVEKGMPGFTAPEIHKKLSLRASVTSELVLQDVRVPGGEPLPRGRHAPRPALVPQRGALRDRLGRRRRRARLLRGGARLRQGADRLRQADRRLPADAAEARRDGARAQPRHSSSRSTSAG